MAFHMRAIFSRVGVGVVDVRIGMARRVVRSETSSA